MIWENVVPNAEVRIHNRPESEHYFAGQEVTFIVELENNAKKSLFFGIKRKITLHDISVQMFFPRSFTIVEIKRHITIHPTNCNGLFEAPLTGKFLNEPFNYVFVPDPFNRVPPRISSLSHQETEWCYVTATLPTEPRTYKLFFDISYQEGQQQTAEIAIQVVPPPITNGHNLDRR